MTTPAVRFQIIPKLFSHHNALSPLALQINTDYIINPAMYLMININISLAHKDTSAWTHAHTLMHYEEKTYKIPLIPLHPSLSPISDLT